jgi:chaperonin GroES
VEPISTEEKTSTGLIIPDVGKQKPLKGTVVLTGPGIKGREMAVKTGDKIVYGAFSGTEIVFGEKTYVMMRETEISAIE